jgi:alpha-galactosidase
MIFNSFPNIQIPFQGGAHHWLRSFHVMFLVLLFSALRTQLVLADDGPKAGKDATEAWIVSHFAKGKVPPFSFVYGGKHSDSFIAKWKFKAVSKKQNADQSEHVFKYSEGTSGLEIKCTVTGYYNFQTVEWLLELSNISSAASPLIEKLNAVDLHLDYKNGGNFVLHYAKGSDAKKSDFAAVDSTLSAGSTIYLTSGTGRSSDQSAFPFFNVETADQKGIVVGVGWTGKWFAQLNRKDVKTLNLRSGMERFKLKLLPNESIRTPLVSMLFWEGSDRMIGHNKFRQFVLAHHSRKINGKFAEYPLSGGFNWGDPLPCNEYSCLTEDYAISLVKRYKQFGIVPEVFWLDAGWYTGCGMQKGGEWWENVGNWTVDKSRFPNGLKPVADAAHEVGAKFMVWFEPERVHKGTQIEKEHPGFLLKHPKKGDHLFNLGDPKARIWMTDHISDLIRQNGIDYYRQDFNMDPMPYWELADAPDRIGISEIRHIEGLYAFWDSLTVRFPQLLIDNCASGGRRLDLETTSRSAPLWRTDYNYGEPNGYQNHTYGLNFYLPLHGTGLFAKADAFTFRSSLSSAMAVNWKITSNQVTVPDMQARIRDFKRLRPYYYGDYYPLTGVGENTGEEVWLAYQMHRPDAGDGIIVAFRRSENDQESITVKPGGLDQKANYEWLNEDTGERKTVSGAELSAGVQLQIKSKPGSNLISYRKVN